METGNGRDGAYNLLQLERRSATRRIPGEQELRRDLRSHTIVATVTMAVARGARYLLVHTDCPALIH